MVGYQVTSDALELLFFALAGGAILYVIGEIWAGVRRHGHPELGLYLLGRRLPARHRDRPRRRLRRRLSVQVPVRSRAVPSRAVSYLQAIVIALVQGVTELFPVSSLGHSVLVPAWIGGSWETLVTQSSQATQRVVVLPGLHRRAALRHGAGAAVVLPRRLGAHRPRRSCAALRAASRARRLVAQRRRRAAGLADRPRDDPGRDHRPRARARLPHGLRQAGRRERLPVPQRPDPARRRARCAAPPSARPAAAVRRRRAAASAAAPPRRPARATDVAAARASDRRIAAPPLRRRARRRRCFQILALLAGISRSGITMVGGLWRGPRHEDAARFAFLLATPVILAAGVLKLPEPVRLAPATTSTARSPSASSSPASPPTSPCASSSATSRPAR